jgi:hypothetical protein
MLCAARDLGLEMLAEVLRGNVLVQNHCYLADVIAGVSGYAACFAA